MVRELKSSLSDIEVIEGSLSIVRSYPLLSLGFFENLRVIHGDGEDRYGLTVIDNQNLEMLFHQNVTVQHGRMYMHFNPKLCMRIIEEFKVNVVELHNVSTLPANEVSTESNGDRIGCNIANLHVNVAPLGHHAVKIMLKTMEYEDQRSLLSYLFYYKPAPFLNMTWFDERDACDTGAWQMVEIIDKYQNSSRLKIGISDLKPNTQYACYIQTRTIPSEPQRGQSGIHYFRTLPYKADVATNLTVAANGTFEMVRRTEIKPFCWF